MQKDSSTTQKARELKPGDEVLVWDEISTQEERYVIADAVERDGKLKVRVIGMGFYFDAALARRAA